MGTMYVASCRTRRIGSAIAGITVVVYFSLVCLAAMCAAAMPLPGSTGEHAHHDHDTTHSSLCAWACQANSQTALSAPAMAEYVSLAALAPVTPSLDPLLIYSSAFLPSRAPPVSTLG